MAGRGTFRERGIVLARTKLSEQDLILTLLSEGGQQLRAVAKGARKPGGRLAARSELFCEVDLLLSRGRSLDVVSEASVAQAHGDLRGDLGRVAAAAAIAEVARLTCLPDMADPFLYPLCARALAACEQATGHAYLDLCVSAYVMKVLSHGGWRPQLDTCVLCGDAAVSVMSVETGGALCSSCGKDVMGAEAVGPEALRWLGMLIGRTFDELLATPVDPQMSDLLARLAWRWAAVHLDVRLRAYEFYLRG